MDPPATTVTALAATLKVKPYQIIGWLIRRRVFANAHTPLPPELVIAIQTHFLGGSLN